LNEKNMSEIDSITRITDILAKSVINQLDERELKELDEWFRSSSRNQELYEKIMKIEDFEEREKLIQTIDLEKAWNRYSTRLTNEIKVKRILPTIWKYAVAILILAFISSIYFVFDRDKPVAEIVVVDDSIKLGFKSAMLVLNNGSRIDFEQQDSLEIKEADGTKIMKKRGLVSYHSLEMDIVEQELNNTIVVPRGGEYSLVLSDGTQVFVNSMSTLEFPVKFHWKEREREVELQGEACFIVTEDSEHPFIVNVNGVKVEVLGITFNINGYSEDKKVVATLVEGKVKLNTTTNEDKHYVLLPNEQAFLI
jgi:transmembrane sensor